MEKEPKLFWQLLPPEGSIVFTITPLRWRSSPPASTYMLKVNVSLAGHVVDDISDVLLSAAADEVLLRSSVLQKDRRTQTRFHWRRLNLLAVTFRQTDTSCAKASPTCRCPWAGRPSAGRCGRALLSDTWWFRELYRCDWLRGPPARLSLLPKKEAPVL